MIVNFEPPFKGQDTDSHFALSLHAVDMVNKTALVMDEEGFLGVIDLNHFQADWRFDREKRTWISIDDPEPDPREE